YELVAGGKKLLGSAQNRRARVVLQHGSLPLFGDLTRLVECLALPDENARAALRRNLADHATTVEQVLGRRASFDEVAEAMALGFSEALGLNLVPGELTPDELTLADQLLHEQYDHPDWTERT
ncbi:MAG: octanoyltransferase, partial [Anaerolineae bacterium]